LIISLTTISHAQTVGPAISAAKEPTKTASSQPADLAAATQPSPSDSSKGEIDSSETAKKSNADAKSDTAKKSDSDEKKTNPADMDCIDRICNIFSEEEDPDGPINTDRPTFTPANTVVPRRRVQFESGFTFTYLQARASRNEVYDLPELAMRYGLANRVEFRTFWLGETWDQAQLRRGGTRSPGGISDMEVGFKWQVLSEDKEKKWRPTTALITSIIAPTGGSSSLGGETVEPYINLIYGWTLTDKLTFGGSTGYLGVRQQPAPETVGRTINYQRYHQSLLAFYSVTDKTTLFYEWYVLMFTHASDNRPLHFMDGGVLYHLTPNMQIDLRAGFGLSGRPDEFFTGTGFSVRF
jgi:hypothetical protein